MIVPAGQNDAPLHINGNAANTPSRATRGGSAVTTARNAWAASKRAHGAIKCNLAHTCAHLAVKDRHFTDNHIAMCIYGHRQKLIESRVGGGAIDMTTRPLTARPCDRAYNAIEPNLADVIITRIDDDHIAKWVHRHTPRRVESCVGGGAIGMARLRGTPGQGADNAVRRELADTSIRRICHNHVAIRVYGHACKLIKPRGGSGAIGKPHSRNVSR
mmetsp:Transcript_11736/g.34898  ORF Transcript_11736/g.34898 Transcript_11736/m.34898 type:complete len:216 (-) Transcript_11736:446-1093(-)